ncbi:MAG: class I SAM-dependent methyltransferase [Acidiferrobacteraceae bacterium]
MKSAEETKKEVEKFWNDKPCDSDRSQLVVGTKEYFLEVERDRYLYQDHILSDVLPKIDWRGKRVLEVGTGVGTDARAIITRGAAYTGINIDQGSVDITRQALETFGLAGDVQKCDVTSLPYENASFDVVYSFGALPCIPDLDKAMAEIHRVLKPQGEFLGLFYNRSSINYQVEIRILRRMFRPLLMVPGMIRLLAWCGLPEDRLAGHRELYRKAPRMSEQEWLSRNTDGPDNPYIRIQDAQEAGKLVKDFEVVCNEVYFFDYRHWGVLGRKMPSRLVKALGRRWGWHRIVHARKPISDRPAL